MMKDNGSLKSDASPFHAGEKEAQIKMGVAEQMEKFGRQVIRPFMPDQHQAFFAQLPVLFAGYVDQHGWPWATMITGHPGFLKSPDPAHLDVNAMPASLDPLHASLNVGQKLGLLGIELHSRRRNRLNATISAVNGEGFQLSVDQSFGNCPQYIRTRNFDFIREPGEPSEKQSREDLAVLDEEAIRLIGEADTFFVSSYADTGEQAASSG
ncbi:MAG: hypothetical protein JKX94_13025, partial [Sneathiella sp.]|nr:hypothetical protein [Sneathiella sp.]